MHTHSDLKFIGLLSGCVKFLSWFLILLLWHFKAFVLKLHILLQAQIFQDEGGSIFMEFQRDRVARWWMNLFTVHQRNEMGQDFSPETRLFYRSITYFNISSSLGQYIYIYSRLCFTSHFYWLRVRVTTHMNSRRPQLLGFLCPFLLASICVTLLLGMFQWLPWSPSSFCSVSCL